MGFVRARFRVEGNRNAYEGHALVDTGACYTVIDVTLADKIGVRYTGLQHVITSFSGHRIEGREAIVALLEVEGRRAPSELLVVCRFPDSVRTLLHQHDACDALVLGVHTLQRVHLVVDPTTHQLVEAPGTLMLSLP